MTMTRGRLLRWAAVLALLMALSGCGDVAGLATRYRAERMTAEIRKEAKSLEVGKERPDSATFLRLRGIYGRMRVSFHPPFVSGTSENAKKVNREVAREVGIAELTGAGYALGARRPDLALESAQWVQGIADDDTALLRESAFTQARAYRGLRRFDEAITTMRSLLQRFPPAVPPTPAQEDPMLGVPDAIVELREARGDSLGAREERRTAAAYFRGVIAQTSSPILAAQAGSHLVRTLLELDDFGGAVGELDELRKLIAQNPGLKPLEPEVLYSQARVLNAEKDPKVAMDAYDLVLMCYPRSTFAVKALLDAAVLCEHLKDRAGALARYRAILDRAKPDPTAGPIASFRLAMVLDQMGNWADAKTALEGIPMQFPVSRAALEAPFAIAEHYARAGQPDAVHAALLRAIDTYRKLAAQDTTSLFGAAYRWSILRAQIGTQQWKDAMATIDDMATRDRGAPIVAQALVEGARIAHVTKNDKRANAYLQRLVLEYPRSPWTPAARKALQESAPGVVKK